MNRFAAPAVLTLVTPLLATFGSSSWSWTGGPVAALLLAVLRRSERDATV